MFVFVFFPGLAFGLEITNTGPLSVEKASGQSVKLDCQFTLGPEDTGPLDIEWSLMASDNQQEDKVVCVDQMLHFIFIIDSPFDWQAISGYFIFIKYKMWPLALSHSWLQLSVMLNETSPLQQGGEKHSFQWKEFLHH